MSNLYSGHSNTDIETLTNMAMSLSGVPQTLRDDPPVCSNVADITSLVPPLSGTAVTTQMLGNKLPGRIYDIRNQGYRFDEDTADSRRVVSFTSLAGSFITIIGVEAMTTGLHLLSAYRTMFSGTEYASAAAASRRKADDVSKSVVDSSVPADDFFVYRFLGGTLHTNLNPATHVLPAFSALHAARLIAQNPSLDPDVAVDASFMPGPAGFYHVYREVYTNDPAPAPPALPGSWEFPIAPAVLTIAAAAFASGHDHLAYKIVDEVEAGIFTTGFGGERPDFQLEATRDLVIDYIEAEERAQEEADEDD